MGGGLMQLVAYGAQDIYLTGNPQITFFKTVYRRHTNFSMESINQTFNSTVEFGKKSSCIIARNGDLITDMYIEITLPAIKQAQATDTGTTTYVSWTQGIGNALLKSVSIDIGGQEIDKHYSEWLDIWGELNLSDSKKKNYNNMVGNNYPSDDFDPELACEPAKGTYTLYVPLRFWFNNNPGLALPLIALQYHDVRINIELESVDFLIRNNNGNLLQPINTKDELLEIKDCNLLVNYVYLDTDERRRFAQVSHEYLIEQVQYLGLETISQNSTNHPISLNFNHPVKVLHWVIQDTTFTATNSDSDVLDNKIFDGGNQKLRYMGLSKINNKYDTFKTGKIQINGHDRMVEKNADYFRLVQNYKYMAGCSEKYIYTYSFALNPSEHQPSGTCNFSRIDLGKLYLTFDKDTISQNTKTDNTTTYTGHIPNNVHAKVFAVNYNVLRIMSGMGGLAYSN
jgi:hypothetical protein